MKKRPRGGDTATRAGGKSAKLEQGAAGPSKPKAKAKASAKGSGKKEVGFPCPRARGLAACSLRRCRSSGKVCPGVQINLPQNVL